MCRGSGGGIFRFQPPRHPIYLRGKAAPANLKQPAPTSLTHLNCFSPSSTPIASMMVCTTCCEEFLSRCSVSRSACREEAAHRAQRVGQMMRQVRRQCRSMGTRGLCPPLEPVQHGSIAGVQPFPSIHTATVVHRMPWRPQACPVVLSIANQQYQQHQ